MSTYKNTTFENETFELDGETYVGCSMNNCVLVFRGGDLPFLSGNTFSGCEWRLDDAALRTVRFLQFLHAQGARDVVNEYIKAIQGGPPPREPNIVH